MLHILSVCLQTRFSGVQSARTVCHHLWPVQLYNICPHYLTNGRIFVKNVTDHKVCVLIFSINFVWNISHSGKNWAMYCHNCTQVFMWSTRYSCQIFMKVDVSLIYFLKIIKQTQGNSCKWPTWSTIILFYKIFITVLYMFRATSCCIDTASGIVTLCKWPSGTPNGHLQTETIPDTVLVKFDLLVMSMALLETCRGL